MEDLKKYISDINDFPNKGIVFKDINPIYKEPRICQRLFSPLEKVIAASKPDYLAGIESRGFITASALAYKLEIGFIPIRKPNKLPGEIIGINYQLEYGEDRLEIQANLIKKNSKILIIDDLLATGGTAAAAGNLISKLGCILNGYCFLIELEKFKGRDKLDKNLIIESVLKY